MNEEEKREYEELKNLLYAGTISQYGKRKLIDMIEKQQREIIEELKESDFITAYLQGVYDGKKNLKYKIKEKIEKIKEDENFYKERDRMYEFNGKINILKELLGE